MLASTIETGLEHSHAASLVLGSSANVSRMERQRLILGAAAALIINNDIENYERERKKRIWTRDWLERRNNGRGMLKMIHSEVRFQDQQSYRNFLRMDEDIFEELLMKVEPMIQKNDTVMRPCIKARDRLAVTLRFLATGETYTNIHFSTRIAANTISIIVPETLEAIVAALDDAIKVPATSQEWKAVADRFHDLWNFPHCLGAIDGKHINFRPPRSSGSYYRNYKGSDSIVLLALVDADYKFLWVSIGVNGRVNDGGVYQGSNLKRALSNDQLNIPKAEPLPGGKKDVPYVIVADDAFPLSCHLMKPYPNRDLTPQKRVYNYRICRSRRVVENAFGQLANKFRVLLTTINLSPSKVELIVKACCVLHNFIKKHDPKIVEREVAAQVNEPECTLKGLQCPQGGNRAPNDAIDIRSEFVKYFNGVGRVPWQNEAVENGWM